MRDDHITSNHDDELDFRVMRLCTLDRGTQYLSALPPN
jgi:hypothetical protein